MNANFLIIFILYKNEREEKRDIYYYERLLIDCDLPRCKGVPKLAIYDN